MPKDCTSSISEYGVGYLQSVCALMAESFLYGKASLVLTSISLSSSCQLIVMFPFPTNTSASFLLHHWHVNRNLPCLNDLRNTVSIVSTYSNSELTNFHRLLIFSDILLLSISSLSTGIAAKKTTNAPIDTWSSPSASCSYSRRPSSR